MGAEAKLTFVPPKTEASSLSNSEVPPVKNHHFDFFQKLLIDSTGIRLLDNKKSLLSNRLSRRLRLHGFSSWDEYIDLLKSGDSVELMEFTNVLTTNKTDFFRENKHFDYIKDTFLPELLKNGVKNPSFWIGASSTGQEVLSLVMTLEEYKSVHHSTFEQRILATDIDTAVLDKCEKAIYPADLVERSVPPLLIKKYFFKGSGPHMGFYRFKPEYLKTVKYRYFNLCSPQERIPMKFDLIMIRNVLIYFSPETVDEVISKAYSLLKDRGVLILGHCESILDMKWKLEVVQQSVYRKM